MIRLIDILKEAIEDLVVPQEAYTGKIYSNSPNVWTHLTPYAAFIIDIKKRGELLDKGENKANFPYGVKPPTGKFDLTKTGGLYFKKGELYTTDHDKYNQKWLITTDLPDEAFQPNINQGNTETFEQSNYIGALKPHPEGKTSPNYRDINNFKFYHINPTDKKWYEFDIDKIKI